MRILFTLLLSLSSFFAAFGQGGGYSSERHGLYDVQIYQSQSPGNDYIYVRLTALKAQDVKLTVHNIIGNEMRVETDILSEDELRVKVKDLPSGYYILTVKDGATQYRSARKFRKGDGM